MMAVNERLVLSCLLLRRPLLHSISRLGDGFSVPKALLCTLRLSFLGSCGGLNSSNLPFSHSRACHVRNSMCQCVRQRLVWPRELIINRSRRFLRAVTAIVVVVVVMMMCCWWCCGGAVVMLWCCGAVVRWCGGAGCGAVVPCWCCWCLGRSSEMKPAFAVPPRDPQRSLPPRHPRNSYSTVVTVVGLN